MNKSALALSIAVMPVGMAWAASPDAAGLAAEQLGTFHAPYYALLDEASRSGVSIAMAQDSSVRFDTIAERGAGRDLFGPNFNQQNKRFLSSAEFEQKVGRAVGILSVGILRESGLMLGSVQGQALALNARPTTTFTSLSAAYALSPTSALTASASSGRTVGFGSADSLIAQLSSVRTTAYSVGLSGSQLWASHDRLSLSLSIPARVRTGAPTADLGSSAAPTSFSSQTLNLRPTAIERDTELSYTTLYGRDGRAGKLTGAVMWRVNPGHDALARPEWLMGLRYGRAF
ncbi:MAG: hypothetical protein ACEQSK_07970 [Sphingomonadaceae bacterium]